MRRAWSVGGGAKSGRLASREAWAHVQGMGDAINVAGRPTGRDLHAHKRAKPRRCHSINAPSSLSCDGSGRSSVLSPIAQRDANPVLDQGARDAAARSRRWSTESRRVSRREAFAVAAPSMKHGMHIARAASVRRTRTAACSMSLARLSRVSPRSCETSNVPQAFVLDGTNEPLGAAEEGSSRHTGVHSLSRL
jgi:hypothetical protein